MNRILTLKVLSVAAPVILLISGLYELIFELRSYISFYLFFSLRFPEGFSLLWTLSNIFTFVTLISCLANFALLAKGNFRIMKFLALLSLFSYFLSRLLLVVFFRFDYTVRVKEYNFELSKEIMNYFIGASLEKNTSGLSNIERVAYYLNSYLSGIFVLLILSALVALVFVEKKHILQKVSSNTFVPSQVAGISTQNNPLTNSKGSSMESNAQWKVKLPGQPDQSVDTATLQMWARSGVIRPDTLVQDVQNGMTYSASQIPSVFSSKSYVTALLLSFFIGYLGIDRFYLGHTGLGIGKLLTFGGCGIWALIDFILIAMRKVNDSQGNPLA